jgi:predicted dithiol-disulfide oxidoreductase (DUF899 family)
LPFPLSPFPPHPSPPPFDFSAHQTITQYPNNPFPEKRFYSSKETFINPAIPTEEITWRPDPGSFCLTIFLKQGEDILHTYTTWSRGAEIILGTYQFLDLTSLGRQEGGDGGKSFKLHDQY